MERREKKMPGHSIFSKPLQYGKACLIFNFLFPHDTVCANHGKKREKYGQAFHFSKPPPQVKGKIS
jgi:hypothetical protein